MQMSFFQNFPLSSRRSLSRQLPQYIGSFLALFFSIAFYIPLQGVCQLPQPIINAEVTLTPGEGTTKDTFILLIKISNTGRGQIRQPKISMDKRLAFNGPSTASSYTVLNGIASSSLTFSYQIRAREELPAGTYKIQVESINIGGQEINLKTVQKFSGIKILKNPTPPAQASKQINDKENITAKQILEPSEVYVGEQLIYTLNFQTKRDILDRKWSSVTLPALREDFGEKAEEFTVSLNRTFGTYNYREALFPLNPGNFKIPDRTLTATMQIVERLDTSEQGELFDVFFPHVGMAKQKFLSTQDFVAKGIEITVKPLPALDSSLSSKKSNDYIPVGELKLYSSIDKDVINFGDSVNLSLSIIGDANIRPLEISKQIIDKLNAEGIRIYLGEPKIETSLENNRVLFKKDFNISIVPQFGGEFTLPTFNFVYFDPKEKVYKSLQTPANVIKINGGSSQSAQTKQQETTQPQNTQLQNSEQPNSKSSSGSSDPNSQKDTSAPKNLSLSDQVKQLDKQASSPQTENLLDSNKKLTRASLTKKFSSLLSLQYPRTIFLGLCLLFLMILLLNKIANKKRVANNPQEQEALKNVEVFLQNITSNNFASQNLNFDTLSQNLNNLFQPFFEKSSYPKDNFLITEQKKLETILKSFFTEAEIRQILELHKKLQAAKFSGLKEQALDLSVFKSLLNKTYKIGFSSVHTANKTKKLLLFFQALLVATFLFGSYYLEVKVQPNALNIATVLENTSNEEATQLIQSIINTRQKNESNQSLFDNYFDNYLGAYGQILVDWVRHFFSSFTLCCLTFIFLVLAIFNFKKKLILRITFSLAFILFCFLLNFSWLSPDLSYRFSFAPENYLKGLVLVKELSPVYVAKDNKSQVISSLKKSTLMEYTKVDNSWVEISLEGNRVGWVNSQDVVILKY